MAVTKGNKSTLDEFLTANTPTGSLEGSVTNTLYGLNSIMAPLFLKKERDHAGFTFVVRPQLNLADYNIERNPALYDLLSVGSVGDDSIWRYVRLLLDPALAHKGDIKSNLLDNKNAFISIITNTVVGVSGWVAPVLPTKESTPGMRKEQIIMPDGDRSIFQNFDLDVTVANFGSSPIDKIMDTWEEYMSANMEGRILPSWMSSNERDYDTRVYRLVMSDDLEYVKHISCTGGSFPMNTEKHKVFDYNNEQPYHEQNKERTIRFASSGAWYDNVQAIIAFNYTVGVFHPGMRKLQKGDDNHNMLLVPRSYLALTNFRCYPRINLDNYKLEWYIDSDTIVKKPKPVAPDTGITDEDLRRQGYIS